MYFAIAKKYTMPLLITGIILLSYLIISIVKFIIIKNKYTIKMRKVEQEDNNSFDGFKKEITSFINTFTIYKEKFYNYNSAWNRFVKRYRKVISKSELRDKVEEEINKFRPIRQEKRIGKNRKIKLFKTKELNSKRYSIVEIHEDKRFRSMGRYFVDYKRILNTIIVIICVWCLIVNLFISFSDKNFVLFFLNNIKNIWHIIIICLPSLIYMIYLIIEDQSDVGFIIITDIIIMVITFFALVIIDIVIFWILHIEGLIDIFGTYQNWMFSFLILLCAILIYIIRILTSFIIKMKHGIKSLNEWSKRYANKDVRLEVEDGIEQIKILAENLYINMCFGQFEILNNESIDINEEQLLFSRINNMIESEKGEKFRFLNKDKYDVISVIEIYRDYMVYDQILGQQMIFDYQTFSKRIKEINTNLKELCDIDNYREACK